MPPTAPMLPVRTTSKYRQRVICQPHRLPAAAARQLCVAKRLPALATACAASTIFSAATPVSAAAYSGVNCAYCALSVAMKLSKVSGRSGCSTLRYSRQFTQSRTNALS